MRRPRSWIAHPRLLVSLLAVVAVVLSFFRIRSTDIFWHLAAGRWMVENRAVPRVDVFRFTSDGAPWVDHEWLFQLVVHALERSAGLDSLVVLRIGLVLVIALLLYRTGRRAGLATDAAVVLAAVSLFGMRPRLILRPELFTFIALLILIELLDRMRPASSTGPWKVIGAMVGLTVVWANLHGAAILAPVIAGLHLLGRRADPTPRGPSLRTLLGVPLVLLAATLVNPYGYHVLFVSFGISAAMRDLPGTNAEWAPQWLAPQPYFVLAVAAVGALAALVFRRTRRLDAPTGLVALALTVVAITAVRHQALFFVAATPFVACTLAALLGERGPVDEPSRLTRYAAPLACGLIVLWTLLPPSSGVLRPRQGAFSPGFGIEPGRFPEPAADLLERHAEIGPLYNTFAWGGYLLWRLFPPRQVFHDGRMELVPELLSQIGEARADARAWEELMLRHGVDGALVRYEERPRPVLEMGDDGEPRLTGYRTANALLFPRQSYALVHWDDAGMLVVRRTPERAAWLETSEYRHVDPEDLAWTLERAAENAELATAMLAETRRRLREPPPSSRARHLEEQLAELAGPG